jgi:hypothetical protein
MILRHKGGLDAVFWRRNPPNKMALSKSYKVDLIWWITTPKNGV